MRLALRILENFTPDEAKNALTVEKFCLNGSYCNDSDV